jgi:hypothetical protein
MLAYEKRDDYFIYFPSSFSFSVFLFYCWFKKQSYWMECKTELKIFLFRKI